ncbi:MAG: ATP-binding protein [Elusimicrobiota bacterium]|jgi:predicted AAA+ superfamily ATPase|nr:ATP-binding protein [Elusimicrobiota bacterium]
MDKPLNIINREQYLNDLLSFKDKKAIKVITGMRRCGKSTLLDLFEQKLLEDGVNPQNIIRINFESMRIMEIKDYIEFYKYVKDKISLSNKTYLLFDEIQLIPNWEKAVNSFLVDFDVDIYITGSNAYLLSSELSTLLSGRYVEIKMLPFSFKEFIQFDIFDKDASIEDKFKLYLQFGGMPSVAEYNFNIKNTYSMLEGIYSTVILKDIIDRNKVLDQSLLRRLVSFLASSIGSTISVNKIGAFLVSDGALQGAKAKSPANKTIENYIAALQNAFIFYPVERYDIRGKSLLKTLGKNYIVDIGLRNMILGFKDSDIGHILENIVFLELMRRGFRVYVGKVRDLEIDFIAESPNQKEYYQVSRSIIDETTAKREFASLQMVNNSYKKTLLTYDKSLTQEQDGIEIKNIIDFLIEK